MLLKKRNFNNTVTVQYVYLKKGIKKIVVVLLYAKVLSD